LTRWGLLLLSQQLFDFAQREAQLLGMPHKCEVANLLTIEQVIPARGATRILNESEFLIEADRVHAGAGQLRGLTDVNRVSHTIQR
jgi:hypothetical protein